MNTFLIFFNISGGEILVIIIVIYLVFGPKKIPEFARMIGKGINEMRRATDDIRNEITREANKVKSDIGIDIDDPFKTTRKTNPPPNTTTEPYTSKKEESSKEETVVEEKSVKEEKTSENKPDAKADHADLK
jgi:TatA/E family protein of Tat protein translocase